MKLLHTSDWHVGKTLRGKSRNDEHRDVLAELTRLADERRVDLVLVAGDVFDSAAPTADAENIVYRALLDLSEVAPVVIVSGNHDNERRLQAVEPLLRLGRITTRAAFEEPEKGGVLKLETSSGERAQVALLPWLSQRYIVGASELMKRDAFEHAGDYAERLTAIIKWLCEGFSPDTVNLIAGHMMVDGGVLGGGERLAHTIFEYCIYATAFPANAHYVALGHLHRAQQLGSQPPVWYCGSPLQLDFGETEDQKCALVVEATASTPARVEQVPLRSGRHLRKIVGTMADLEAIAGTTGDDYLRVVVRGDARAGLAEDVRELFGENTVDVMIQTDADLQLGLDPRAHESKSPKELFREYLGELKAADERVIALFDELLEEEHATAQA
jgi:exonuclease SbcD